MNRYNERLLKCRGSHGIGVPEQKKAIVKTSIVKCYVYEFFGHPGLHPNITVAKRPCYGLLKIKPSYYCSSLCINLVRILSRPTDSNECRFGYHCRRRASDYCN